MTKLEAWLQRACEVVGLKVDYSFEVTCPDGHNIQSIARIRDVGDLWDAYYSQLRRGAESS